MLLRLNVLSQMSHRYFLTLDDRVALALESRGLPSGNTPDATEDAEDVEPASKEHVEAGPKRNIPACDTGQSEAIRKLN